MREIEYMAEVLSRVPCADHTSFWGGALMLLNGLNSTNSINAELAMKLEKELQKKLDS